MTPSLEGSEQRGRPTQIVAAESVARAPEISNWCCTLPAAQTPL